MNAVSLLQELIRFDTTNPPGNEAACIDHVRQLLAGVGVESELYAKEPGRPNLVARLPGGGDSAPLLLQGHVDVVTTAGQDWAQPPFGGELVDGYVWGRGALDMKGGVAMLVSAFVRAVSEGVRPPGDVILVVLADEEAGGDNGARFLVEDHAHLFDGVRYAIGEFGAFSQETSGRRFYPIQVAEKQICWLKVTVHGPGGHAALLQRGGAMARLGKLLTDLDRHPLPIHLTPPVAEMISGMADSLPRPRRDVMRALLRPRLTERMLPLLGDRRQTTEALLRNTANATIVRASDKINVLPGTVEVEIDARALPGFTPQQVMAEVRDVIGDDVELELVRHDAGPSEVDLGLFDVLAGVLGELDPEAIPIPFVQPGVTDARFFAQLGIQTYGFLPMKLPPDFQFTRYVHAADERIPAAAVEFGAEAVYRALQRF